MNVGLPNNPFNIQSIQFMVGEGAELYEEEREMIAYLNDIEQREQSIIDIRHTIRPLSLRLIKNHLNKTKCINTIRFVDSNFFYGQTELFEILNHPQITGLIFVATSVIKFDQSKGLDLIEQRNLRILFIDGYLLSESDNLELACIINRNRNLFAVSLCCFHDFTTVDPLYQALESSSIEMLKTLSYSWFRPLRLPRVHFLDLSDSMPGLFGIGNLLKLNQITTLRVPYIGLEEIPFRIAQTKSIKNLITKHVHESAELSNDSVNLNYFKIEDVNRYLDHFRPDGFIHRLSRIQAKTIELGGCRPIDMTIVESFLQQNTHVENVIVKINEQRQPLSSLAIKYLNRNCRLQAAQNIVTMIASGRKTGDCPFNRSFLQSSIYERNLLGLLIEM